MSSPLTNVTRIWVRGRMIDMARAATGENKYGSVTPVTFVPSPKVMVNAELQQIISAGPFRVVPDEATGYFQIPLPATDDPDVTPVNWTYRVSEGSTGRIYDIVVPQATPILNSPGDPLNGLRVLELSTIVPAPGPASGTVQLMAGRGVESIDIVDDQFVVTYSDDTTQIIGDVPAAGGGTATPDATTTTKGKARILGGTADAPTVPYGSVTGAPTSLPPSGGAGGVLGGTYPNPSFAVDMTTQAEFDAHLGSFTNPHAVTKAQVGLGSVDNVSAASLRDRSTHTGTQASTTISDFAEAVQDAVAALLGAGSNVTLNYDDAANTLTVSATGAGGTGLDVEQVRDAIGVALVGVGNIAVVVNDAADTITISTTATANATDAQLRDRSTHTGTQAASTVTGLASVATSGAYADLSGKPAGDAVFYLPAPSGDATGVADTTAIRSAVAACSAAGGGTVRAQPGKTYQIVKATTQSVRHPSGSTATRDVCVSIPSNVLIDGAGSTFQLRGSTEAWLFANARTDGSARDTDLGLINARLDMRNIAYSVGAALHISHADGVRLDVTLVNGTYFGVWCYNVTDSDFPRLRADGFQGQPFQFGDPQAGGDGLNQVYRSRFGSIHVQNTTLLNTGSQPGNPFALCGTGCVVDRISAYNCSAGVKIYAPGRDNTFGTVLLDTCGEASALNSGFKFQGDATYGNIRNCTVGEIVAVNQANMGLALLYTQDCSVGSYLGRSNSLLATNGDVFLGGGVNDFIGYVSSTLSGSAGVRISQAPTLAQIPTGFRLPNVRVTNPGQVSATIKSGVRIDYAGASGTLGDVVCVDDQGTHTMSRGVDVTVTGVVGSIATFTTSGATVGGFNSASTGFAVASTSVADATTSTKGKAVLLGGTADVPTVPWASVTSKPTIPAAYGDLTGTVPQSALPSIALTEFLGAAASQAAMLALSGQRGDWCTRTDLGTDWQLITEPSTSLASWRQMTYPASPVSSVNGRTGAVTGLAEATDVTTASTADRARANHTGTQAASTITGLAAVATSGSAADLTGTLSDSVIPAGIARDSEITAAVRGDWTKATGPIRANMPRNQRLDPVGALVSGRLTLVGIELLAGDVVTTITFFAGAIAAATPTNQWFALYDSSRNLLGVTADGTTGTWNANAIKTLTLASPYTVTASGLYYLGVMVAATTVPNLTGVIHAGTNITSRAPVLSGASTTGLTDPASAPATAAAPTGLFGVPYAEVA